MILLAPIDGLSEAARARLADLAPEAGRRLSPRGLEIWREGAAALTRIGRGDDLVCAWIEAAPPLARELGEDVLPDLAQECLGLASRTSGAVIAQVLATAPLAARRLGDADLFRAYLGFLNVLLAQAPRGLRPMLDHLDELLGVLTLGGLRRWALWGAEAHRTNYAEQARYFALDSAEAKAVLQRERKGTLFVDIHRRIGAYLRALWGRDFAMRPTSGDYEAREGLRPFIEGGTLHLPDAWDDWQGVAGLDLYRAAAAHAAAHLVARRGPIGMDGLSPLQRACIGLFEDARAEALAIARFPRLRDLWARFHTGDGPLDRIARALLLDEATTDPHALWSRAALAGADPSEATSRALGLALAERLGPSPPPAAPYRDDNRALWETDEAEWDMSPAPEQRRLYVSVSEMVNEVEVETAGEDAQEVWVCASAFFDDDGTSFNAREGREPVAPPRTYPEFDHRIGLDRPDWATVLEKRPKPGDPQVAEAILTGNRPILSRMRRVLEAMQPQGVQRLRRLEEGDDLDLNAAIAARLDLRLGRQPDPRVMMRQVRRTRDVAVMLLLDLSQSTNDPAGAEGRRLIDVTREATVLLAEAVHRVGDPCALHGFCSDGRHNVFYQRFKDFGEDWGPMARARLAGMEGRLSTRMGAAIRHAGWHLGQQRAARKLLLVLTDGAPADIDVRDPAHLRHDARAAVEEVSRQGVRPFCLTLDPQADSYVAQIFGPRGYQILDRIDRLPERLPRLYAGLAR
ncbi:VWA domain-containing protein (plasmid) [Cereibacter azotoformans]|uniref:nitric oxide reductase activation protein NorD n=1 Tax=Cereibacter azotoformans TaxID=43057 RepID=UPI001EEBDF82|nr:VWA domain-containing protein [Cereibacter azotoformans]ULB12100.1 VWA domain-containing protein [Cereibacter azotoformans]